MNKALHRLELVPIDDAPRDDAPAPAPPPPKSSTTSSPVQKAVAAAGMPLEAIEIPPAERPIPNAPGSARDAYVAQALREYAQGRFDIPLWDRALKQNNGDAEAAAKMYIPARAVALRMADRKRRQTVKRAAQPAPEAKPATAERSIWQRYRIAIVAAALLVPAGIVGAIYMASGDEEAVAETTPAVVRKAAAPAANRSPGAADLAAQQAAKAAQESAKLAAKVQELRDAGNFNVMVLYATEWTRKEPDNAAAWDELRAGYLHLRQYEDARSAAKKAAQLKPDDARLWRNLALVNLDLDDPEGALAAYEQAAARNSADVESLHAIALLHARLHRPDEAKRAFDSAAAASPGDPITACLRNGVAQMPAARDAYTMSRQIRSIDNRCHGRSDAVASTR